MNAFAFADQFPVIPLIQVSREATVDTTREERILAAHRRDEP
jgi:hypothetical protein